MALLGAILWTLPLLWPRGEVATSTALGYVFATWTLLIGLALVLSRHLRPDAQADQPGTGPEEDE